jgi:hypothetical protein
VGQINKGQNVTERALGSKNKKNRELVQRNVVIAKAIISSSTTMVRQISTIKYNLCPQFPAAVVTRYPSLTRALGNNYPRLEVTSFDEVHQ